MACMYSVVYILLLDKINIQSLGWENDKCGVAIIAK